jgi:glucose-1-phosphate adenylyltransferase
MDYRPFIEHHRATKADVTISVLPVKESRASGFGLLKIDAGGWVRQFSEKPKGSALDAMRTNPKVLERAGADAEKYPFLASMGIYVFKRQALNDLLQKHPEHADFGHNVIPAAIDEYKVQAYPFQGYWEDIGTVESFFHANLALVEQPKPDFSFFNAEFPVYTHARFLPPSKVLDSTIRESMISDGCLIRTATITHSIIGIRSFIEEGTTIENTLMMGADFYEMERSRAGGRKIPPIGVGAGSVIRNAIIDKNTRIGRNVRITNEAGVQHADREDEGYCIRSGIVVVIKGAVIKDNTVI